MVRPWKAGHCIKNTKLVRFRIIRMAFCSRDSHETRRARARIVRCHHDSGNNKAASLLRLLSFKVSNRHGLAKYADMQGGTLVSPPSHLTDSSRKWTNIAREYDSCAHRRCWTAAASCPYYSCRRRAKAVGLVLPSVY